MSMSMLTLNEADNKVILYTFIDIDFRYSYIASLFQYSLSMANWNIITVARNNDLLIFWVMKTYVIAANNEVKC